MTIQEALRLGNKVRRQCWHPTNYILVYEGNTFFNLSSGDLLAYDWESEVIELPRLQRMDESGNMNTEDPAGKKWCPRRGMYLKIDPSSDELAE